MWKIICACALAVLILGGTTLAMMPGLHFVGYGLESGKRVAMERLASAE